MSALTLDSGLAAVREALLAVVWGQWTVLGGRGGGRIKRPRAVVDPEALVLASCALRDDEPRLWDMAAGFVAQSSGLLSVQRTRNLAKAYPPGVRTVLKELAAVAKVDGRDARWAPLAAAEYQPYRASKFAPEAVRLMDPATLVLRLRLAFGVQARTDVLAFLLTSGDGAFSAKQIAEGTGYGSIPIRRACELMSRSRLLRTEGARPERYRVRRVAWMQLLELPGNPPRWRHWQPIFAFLAHLLEWDAGRAGKRRSAYLESGDVRRLVLEHAAAFSVNRLDIKPPADYQGEAFIEGFASILTDVRQWLEKG